MHNSQSDMFYRVFFGLDHIVRTLPKRSNKNVTEQVSKLLRLLCINCEKKEHEKIVRSKSNTFQNTLTVLLGNEQTIYEGQDSADQPLVV